MTMKNQIKFVSVDEKALETVAGGLADVANYAVNCNDISVLSDIGAFVATGDVASYILNVLNEVH
jgi:hypothetical protein